MSTINSRINTPLRNYFFYKSGINITKPLTDGYINFFKNDDHSEGGRLNVYQDPDLTIPYSNPLILDSDGGCPPIYLQAEPYYIEVWSSEDQLQFTLENYEGAIFSSDTPVPSGSEADNIFTNGQFTYPIDFSLNNDEPGLVSGNEQEVAFAWIFSPDTETEVKDTITFEDVSNEDVESNPLYQLVLTSTDVSVSETRKNLSQLFSNNVNKYQGEQITFSFQMVNMLSGTVQVNLILGKYYGRDGSETDYFNVTTFNVTTSRQKYTFTYTVPTNEDKIIGADNYLMIILEIGIGQLVRFGITNCLALKGEYSNPIYPEEPTNIVQAKILGNQTQFTNSADSLGSAFPGNYDNYNKLMYVNGNFLYLGKDNITGDMMIETIDQQKPWQRECDGSSIEVSGYYNYIPNRRLYDVIGDTYGGAGDLIVTAQSNIVVFNSAAGAREKSAYTAGDLGSKVTVTNTIKGLRLGIEGELTASTVVTCTFLDEFAPNPTPSITFGYVQPISGAIGYWIVRETLPTVPIEVTITDPGSGSTQCVAELNFASTSIAEYRTHVSNGPLNDFSQVANRMLEFASIANNGDRGNYAVADSTTRNTPIYSPMCIAFSVDGTWDNSLKFGGISGSEQFIVVPFSTSLTLTQNIAIFLRSVNNPFEWRVTFNAAPSASQYFLYSSAATNYYAWYQVDGVGTDPAIAMRTGVMVAITSGDTLGIVAQKTADALDSLTYSLPDQATDLPEIPAGGLDKLAWYINI